MYYIKGDLKILAYLFLTLLACSCLKHNSVYKGSEGEDLSTPLYLYPFDQEGRGYSIEITLQTKIDPDLLKISIPPLKYNKSWLFLLTQDDCKHAAYSYTWAAINGRPLSKKYFYDVRQYLCDDLPPDAYYLGKTLGSTDGAGNEVRFSFTTTLSPEWDFMNASSVVEPVNSKNDYRFFMKSGLIWENVIDMMNYGTSIAFHDVLTTTPTNPDSILVHYRLSQDSILKHLSGRGCKFLAEPNGNKTYIVAAKNYTPIQIITAQAQATRLYPFRVSNDLRGQVIQRSFYSIADTKEFIKKQLQLSKEEREAVSIGVHGTATDWVEFFLWLNDTYGKDGDDSMWFTSLEEYYEYNYYRIHSNIEKIKVDDHTWKLKITLPVEEYFYYPSLSLYIEGLSTANVASVTTDDLVKGLSYGDNENGVILNVDCRKFLVEHAIHFIERYEEKPNIVTKRDALYFINSLKNSAQKEALLKRIK